MTASNPPPTWTKMDPVGPPSAVTMSAQLARTATHLLVHARVRNGGATPIYVLDRTWLADKSGTPTPDPEHVYRLYRNRSLRILLGLAPPPPVGTVSLRLVPFATRVDPGGDLGLEVSLAIPVREYNPFFPESPRSAVEDAQADDVELLVQYVPLADGVTVQQSPWRIGGAIVSPARQADHAISPSPYVRAAARVSALPVLRRIDELQRLALPGEPPIPVMLTRPNPLPGKV